MKPAINLYDVLYFEKIIGYEEYSFVYSNRIAFCFHLMR